MPVDTGQYFDKLRTQFQAGGGDIDLILGDVIWPAQFAVNGWVVGPLRPLQGHGRVPVRSDAVLDLRGQGLGRPLVHGRGAPLLQAGPAGEIRLLGAPGDLDELQEMAAKVMKDQGIENGFVFQGDEYEGGVCNGCEYIWSARRQHPRPRRPDPRSS